MDAKKLKQKQKIDSTQLFTYSIAQEYLTDLFYPIAP
jgi:hypothetical protein